MYMQDIFFPAYWTAGLGFLPFIPARLARPPLSAWQEGGPERLALARRWKGRTQQNNLKDPDNPVKKQMGQISITPAQREI
jgi:hypothetical protein